jgi:hypothetical protein
MAYLESGPLLLVIALKMVIWSQVVPQLNWFQTGRLQDEALHSSRVGSPSATGVFAGA